ncbi:uncharacterized protein EHS24_009560 [Apiotrichum porosum]|uniref:Uncharacterized protein n=1 Tax=Apiotrichum porosum TaxID=105984 RepID=A0A427XMB5_9TREE|nr:uncharacterized protein EHS24_009560 [Apiotrichum porosum]RSH79894.1 hypothetical protein EHS24_009560 [Apiotrichum porosum]
MPPKRSRPAATQAGHVLPSGLTEAQLQCFHLLRLSGDTAAASAVHTAATQAQACFSAPASYTTGGSIAVVERPKGVGSSSRPTAPARPVPAQAPTSEPEQTSVVRRNGHVLPTVIVELPSPRRLRSSLGRPNAVIAVAPAPFAGPVTASSLVPALTPQVPLQHIPPKRGRGRPRKHSLPVMHVGQSQTPATTGALPIPAAPPHGHLGPSLRLRLRQRVPEASRDHPSSTSSSAKSRVRPAKDGAAAARKAPRLSAPGRLTTTVPAVDAVGPSGFCGPTASPVTGPRPVPAAVAAQLPSPARSGVDIVRGFMDKNKRPRLSESDLLLFHQRHAGVDIAPDTTDKEKRPAGVYQTRSGVDIHREQEQTATGIRIGSTAVPPDTSLGSSAGSSTGFTATLITSHRANNRSTTIYHVHVVAIVICTGTRTIVTAFRVLLPGALISSVQ